MTRSQAIHLVLFAVAVLVLLAILCMRCRGEWVTVEPIRQSGHPGLIGELEDRVPASRAEIYRDADRVTWAHEQTHHLNSVVRNRYAGTGRTNAAYCFGGQAQVLPEPRGLTLSAVARAVTSRGSLYALYLVQQQRDWNNEPLYICDELSAYTNGAAVGIELSHRSRAAGSLSQAREMAGYCRVLLRLARARGYAQADELEQFLDATDAYHRRLDTMLRE